MINLKELLIEKQKLEKLVNNYTSRINEKIYNIVGVKSMNYSDLKVQTSHCSDSATLNALISVEELYKERQSYVEKLIMNQQIIDDFYKKTNDRNTKIYMERYFYGHSAIQIGIKFSKSERQIQRICKEYKKRLEKNNE